MDIKIDVDQVVRKVRATAVSMLNSSSENLAERIVSELTSGSLLRNKDGSLMRPRGLVFEMALKKVDDYVLSSKFEGIMDRLIEEEVEEQARGAIRTLLNSRTRKHLFEATKS